MKLTLFIVILCLTSIVTGQDSYLPEAFSKKLPVSARTNYQSFIDSSRYILFLDDNRIMMSAEIQKGVCDEKYDEEKQTGTFKPTFIDSGYYFSYSITDIQEKLVGVSSLSQDSDSYRTSGGYASCGNASRSGSRVYSNIVGDSSGNRMIQHELVKRPECTIRYDRSDRPRVKIKRSGSNVYRNSMRYTSFSLISNREAPSIFGMNDNFYCFNESANEFIELDKKGMVINQTNVRIKKPAIYSKKDQRIVLDETAKELYVLVLTNFGYNWYSLDEETGETSLVLKIDGMWLNPDWKIEDGVLSYQKMENGVMIRKSEDL